MGVPKFYRWLSERYPKINQIVTDNALLPEVDHLYLDLNGVIHGATHPSGMDVSEVLTEREMMLGIVQYIDRMITQIVKPKVSVYMAIDGVAPRAKMNQQRSRRFRSAKDLAEATKDLPKDVQSDGTMGPNVFDSNCITPGTVFLEKVSNVIRYFIRKKIKEDPLWHSITVIFSGHDIPGEGEHKIMQHIREMRADPNYKPNTRHCIYGQDADLIMLGLVTHEPHFTILREVIDFNFGFRNQNTLKAVKKFTKNSDFQLLHLSVLREYLYLEFCSGNPEYDLERVIDDFVFMTFLVGNDFLPHMPTLDIGDGAFDLLFGVWRDCMASWGAGNYLTESGRIRDPARLEEFLVAIGAVENEILEKREKDEAAYVKKRRRWDRRDGKPEGPSDLELQQQEAEKQGDYLSMIESLMAKQSLEDDDFVDGFRPSLSAEKKDFKGRYYFEKLKLTPVDKKEHRALRKSYMEGLIWCLAYYYEGCISWGWFYPYHYGPMLSDLTDLPAMFSEIKFEPGEPLPPFEQLMGCLPPASAALVPKPYRWLMTSSESPIIQFYPVDFEVDMNGKKNPWEGVNLLPFIDVKLLKETVAKYCPPSVLSDDENRRNRVGKVFVFRYDITCSDVVESPNKAIGFSDIVGSCSSVMTIDKQESTGVPFQPRLLEGTQIPFPGFPSLNVIPIASAELIHIGLNCFGTASKYPTMMLSLHQMPELPPIEVLAENVLGKSLFVNWPMMHEAQVVAISDETKEVRLKKGKTLVTKFDSAAAERWRAGAEGMQQLYHTGVGIPGSGGVNIGDVRIRLKVLPLQGMKTNPTNGSTKKVFGQEEADVPLQLALWQAPAPDPRFVERGPMTLEERFPEGSSVVLTKGKYRGCKGTVVGIADKKNVAVKVDVVPPELPFGLAIARSVQESYISSVDAAKMLKIHPGVMGKITGRLQFEQGKYDLGLNLKYADGSCVVGYTRKKIEQPKKGKGKDEQSNVWTAGDSLLVVGSLRAGKAEENEERIQWEYTPKAIRLVESYRRQFPQLFTALKKKPNEKKYDANDVFGPNGEAWLPVVRKWLDEHDTAKLPRSPVTSESMSYEAVAAVQKASDVRTLAVKKRGYPKESLIKIPGSALYREGSTGPTDILLASDLNDGKAPELGDRIVNLCADGIPFGLKGTVVAIHEASTTGSVEVVMDEEFVGGSSLQGACSNFRGKLCVWAHLLKITPENSEGVVEKLVPKGSGKAAVDRIVSSIQRQVKDDNTAQMKSSWDGQVDSVSAESQTATPVRTHGAAQSGNEPQKPDGPASSTQRPPSAAKTPNRSSSRAGSAARGRQGAWKEARGPDEKSLGFKGERKGKSGLQRWKSFVKEQQAKDQPSDELKALLGVGSGTSGSGKAAAVATDTRASQLKAILGVGPTPPSTLPPVQSSRPAKAEADLKAMLGVSQPQPSHPTKTEAELKAILGVPSQSTQPPAQPSAADKLFQLMASRQAPNVAPMAYPPAVHSAFNFTYVEEGQSQPPPPPLPVPPPMPHPPAHAGPYGFPAGPMPVPMHPYGVPQPHGYPMMAPFPSNPPVPPRRVHNPSAPNPKDFPPLGANGPSPEEFPPLGATAPPVVEKQEEVVPKPTPATSVIVPTAVAAKASR